MFGASHLSYPTATPPLCPPPCAHPPVPCRCTYVIEVLCVLHDVWSPLILLQLHPALPKEFSANHSGQVKLLFPSFMGCPSPASTTAPAQGGDPTALAPTVLERDHVNVVDSVMVVGGSP